MKCIMRIIISIGAGNLGRDDGRTPSSSMRERQPRIMRYKVLYNFVLASKLDPSDYVGQTTLSSPCHTCVCACVRALTFCE